MLELVSSTAASVHSGKSGGLPHTVFGYFNQINGK